MYVYVCIRNISTTAEVRRGERRREGAKRKRWLISGMHEIVSFRQERNDWYEVCLRIALRFVGGSSKKSQTTIFVCVQVSTDSSTDLVLFLKVKGLSPQLRMFSTL